MSLMNQVLRDLQQRQIAPAEAGLQAQVIPVATPARYLMASCVLLVGILLILIVLRLFAFDFGESPNSVGGISNPSVESEITESAVMAALPGVHLTAVRLVTASNYSRLLIEFSQAPGLEPEMLMDGRRMRILFPELITTAQQLPQPGVNDSLVRHLSLLKVDHLWQLQVEFNTDVRVETVPIKADLLHGERLAFDFFPLSPEVPLIEKNESVPVSVSLPEEISKKVTAAPVLTKQRHLPTSLEKAQDLYHKGIAATQKEHQEAALGFWLHALRLQPKHLMARKRAIIALLPSDRGQADYLFSIGMAVHSSLDFRKWYARTLLSLAGPAQAITVLTEQNVDVKEDAEYIALQAALWQQTGEYSKSQRAYRELLGSFPEKEIYLFGFAVALDQQAKGTEALSYYRRALNGLKGHPQRYARQRIEDLAASGAGN